MMTKTYEEKLEYNRQLIEGIKEFIEKGDKGYCGDINCNECPLNIGKEEIVCITAFKILR